MGEKKLGKGQIYILGMVDPEWPTKSPDARSVRVLQSLERRGMTYQNFGRWYITPAGKAAKAAAEQETKNQEHHRE